MSRKIFFLIIVLVYSVSIFPQGEGAIPFLTIPVSPKSAGAGGTGTANIQSDPFGYWSNPAYLGYASDRSFVTAGFYPGVIDWLGYDVMSMNSYTISGGYNLQNQYSWLPISVGAAFSKWQFNTDFGDGDNYSSYSIALGYHSIVNFSAGLTIKNVTSSLGDFQMKHETDVTAMDYGFLLNLPLNNFLKDPLQYRFDNSSTLNLDVNYNLGYTIQNVGDEVYYVDEAQKDPISRTGRLAHNINLGFNLNSDIINIELLNFSYSIDAVDILIGRKNVGDTASFNSTFEYQGLLGDIKPGKNLFLGKGDSQVLIRKGLEIELAEIVYLSWGGFDGRGYDNRNTSGIGLNLTGLLKIANMIFPGTILNQFIDKVNIQYNQATYFKDSPIETDYQGIALTISGF